MDGEDDKVLSIDDKINDLYSKFTDFKTQMEKELAEKEEALKEAQAKIEQAEADKAKLQNKLLVEIDNRIPAPGYKPDEELIDEAVDLLIDHYFKPAKN